MSLMVTINFLLLVIKSVKLSFLVLEFPLTHSTLLVITYISRHLAAVLAKKATLCRLRALILLRIRQLSNCP